MRGSENGVNIGNVCLVYGNDGWDVIADYHNSLAGLLEGAEELAEEIEEGYWESKFDNDEENRLC